MVPSNSKQNISNQMTPNSLSAEADGYAWNAASNDEKMKLSETFAKTSKHNCSTNYFFDAFNEFYYTSNPEILSKPINSMAYLFESASKTLPEAQRNY